MAHDQRNILETKVLATGTNCIHVIPSPESMDEKSESEHSGGSSPPSQCSSPGPATPKTKRNQKKSTALPNATSVPTSSALSTSTSTQSQISSSQTPSPSPSFSHSPKVHPSISSVILPPYSADSNHKANENSSIPLGQCMHLIALQSPTHQVGYPLLQPTLQGPSLPLPPLPPPYDTISKNLPPPSLASIQPRSSGNSKMPNSTAAHNFHVPSVGITVLADHLTKQSGFMQQPPHTQGAIQSVNHAVGSGQIQRISQQKQEMGVVPVMSTVGSMQFPSAPVQLSRVEGIMGGGGHSQMAGIEQNCNGSGRRQGSRKRPLSQSGQPLQGGTLEQVHTADAELGVYVPLIRDTLFPGVRVPTDGGQEVNGSQSQHLKWQAHMVNTWHDICDGALQDIPEIDFHVETDKGFNFSIVDDAFVCQKKNHFQVTVQVKFQRIPKFLKMKDGSIQPVEHFTVHLHGVKFEHVNCVITLEQSLPNRTKRKFVPSVVEMPTKHGESCKVTICRLHFSETTANNMRKRGKPNPDQKYFSLVVALHAETPLGSFPVVQHVSERIIVRASNPGNFDNECDYAWLRAANPDIIFHNGRVGINTDKPEEALAVNGSIQLTGQILQVSDARVKRNITMVDSKQQLDTVSKFQLYEYQFAEGVSCDQVQGEPGRRRVGLLAQEVRNLIPEAVKETHSDVTLTGGSVVSNLLMVDKDRILMETVGAVQELKRIADKLERRLDRLEDERTSGSLRQCQQPCKYCFHHCKVNDINDQSGRHVIATTIFAICTVLFLVSMGCMLFMYSESSAYSNITAVSIEEENISSGQFIGHIIQSWLQQ